MLEEFVSMVTDLVPELLTSHQRAQLTLGLRARVRRSSQLLATYNCNCVFFLNINIVDFGEFSNPAHSDINNYNDL